MPTIKCPKEKFKKVALSMYSQHGFNATSIGNLTKELGIRKSSFYHHYPSKESLLSYLLDEICKFEDNNLFSHLYQKNMSLNDRVLKFLHASEEYYLNDVCRSSFIAMLCHEITLLDSKYATLIKNYVAKWVKAFDQVLSVGDIKNTREISALVFYQQLMGAVLLRRVHDDNESIACVFKRMGLLIQLNRKDKLIHI